MRPSDEPLVDAHLTVRMRGAFEALGVRTMRELAARHPDELSGLPNVGRLTFTEVRDWLAELSKTDPSLELHPEWVALFMRCGLEWRVELKRGERVQYVSGSGRVYDAEVTGVPREGQNPNTKPTIALTFRDERGKLVRKPRVLHASVAFSGRKVWRAL